MPVDAGADVPAPTIDPEPTSEQSDAAADSTPETDAGDAGGAISLSDAATADTTAPLPSGSVVWQVTTYSIHSGMAFDRDGSIVVGGFVSDKFSNVDIWLARYSPEGRLLMRKSFGGPGDQWIAALDIAIDGSLVAVGGFEGIADLGGQTRTSAGGTDLFAASYRPDGRLNSVWTFGGPGFDDAYSILVDQGSGDWIVGGYGDQSLGGQTGEGELLFRMDASGQIRWVQLDGGSTVTEFADMGPIFVGGGFLDTRVHSYSRTDGAPAWSQPLGHSSIQIMALAPAPAGRLIASGRFSKEFPVGGGYISSRGYEDAFVQAISADTGKLLWSDVVAASQGNDDARATCADVDGNVYVGAVYYGTEALIPGDPFGAQRSLLVKYNADGERLWSKVLEMPSAGVWSLLCGPDGVVVGSFDVLLKIAP
jgi:outer membrane protein assembly factor BamB